MCFKTNPPLIFQIPPEVGCVCLVTWYVLWVNKNTSKPKVFGSQGGWVGSSLALWNSRLHGAPLPLHQLFQENHPPTWRIIPGRQGYVVHGPWTPSKLPFYWLINGGNPNYLHYLLTGMILQASPPLDMDFTPAKNIFQGHFSITGRFWQMPASRSHQKWRAIQNQNKCNTKNIQGGEHKQTIHHNSL